MINCLEGCQVCKSDNKMSCLTTDALYKIVCPSCGAAVKPLKTGYNGETARMVKSRAQEHLDKLRKKYSDSPLWQHALEYHNSQVPDYQFKVTGSFPQKPLHRQLMEAVKIDRSTDDVTLNSKNEWILPMSINVNVSRGSDRLG